MATQTAPVKKSSAKSPFGRPKKPDVIIYEMVRKNDRSMRDDTPEYPPYREIPNKDTILWNFGTEEKPDWGERVIRYLPGFSSIFVDEQEKDGREIDEKILNNRNNKFIINKGRLQIRPSEKQKLLWWELTNWNIDSKNRTGKVPGLMRLRSEEKDVAEQVNRQDNIKDALEKAYSASEAQIAFHAKYLGIPLIDNDTQASRTLDAVKKDYRQKALDDPFGFLKTYDDDDLKLKYLIDRALEDNVLSTALSPGKMVYVPTKEILFDLSEPKNAVEETFLYCQTQDGEKIANKLLEAE